MFSARGKSCKKIRTTNTDREKNKGISIENPAEKVYPCNMKADDNLKPRLLALDLDDTLLRSDLSISHRIRSAIKRTEAAGVTVVLASGRIPSAMEQFSKLLGLNKRPGYLVSNNGALIQESNTGKIIHEAKINRKTVLAVCDLADAEGFPVQMYDGDILYVSRQNEFSSLEEKLSGMRQVVVENFRAMVGEGCYKLVIPGEPKLLIHVEKIIKAYFEDDITLFNGRRSFLELMSKGTDKGSALAKIAKTAGIKPSEAVAIGDSSNDEAMIRWAGIGVAMANSDERIKSIADFITDGTNDEDGVAEVIEKYFLEPVLKIV